MKLTMQSYFVGMLILVCIVWGIDIYVFNNEIKWLNMLSWGVFLLAFAPPVLMYLFGAGKQFVNWIKSW